MTNKIYAGIGNRKTPLDFLSQMTQIAQKLDSLGYILRSGGAKGADRAFGLGSTQKLIFKAEDATQQSIYFSSEFHPNWSACDRNTKQLHGRNSMIILGPDLDYPVDFVVCWTPNGEFVGGTGLALRIANKYNIPIYNLALEPSRLRLEEFLKNH